MREDRAMTIMGALAAFFALMAFSVGKVIIGGIAALVAAGIFYTRGGGRFNDRSLYEKVIRTDLTIEELYDKIKEMSTPLGRPWLAVHKGYEGQSIVFGPTVFKDIVVISRKKDSINIRHITSPDSIIRSAEDEYRFEGLINAGETEVTPKRYSIFVSFNVASVTLIDELTALTEKLSDNREAPISPSPGVFSFYYHNSYYGWFRDMEDNDVLRAESVYSPFTARVLDADGAEMASVRPRAFDSKGTVLESAGFDIYADGEHYGDIKKISRNGSDVFVCNTDAGEFEVSLFPACRRANVSCNYRISKDGILKAMIAGSAKIVFEAEDQCQNDVIMSYDDDYLVLYAALEIFVMTLGKRFLK